MKVPKERLDEILNCYMPDYVFLKNVESDFPIVRGDFYIGSNFYFAEGEMDHFTAIEAQFCFNQLAYVSLGEWILNSGSNDMSLSYSQFLEKRGKGILIRDHNVRFKSSLDTSKIIKSELKIKKTKKFGKLLWLFCDYSFEDGIVSGDSKCVIDLS